jgi:hypothetical protein
MRQVIFGLISLSFSSIIYGQTEINSKLKKELDSIYGVDQKYRELLFSDILKTKADSVAASYSIATTDLSTYLMSNMMKADSSNLARTEQILNQYGYPGKSLVGIPTNEAAFYVIQHSEKIDQYLPIVKKAADQKELPFKLYAMMLDRSMMNEGKEQIYGTQATGFEVFNPQTGKKEFKMIIWPIQNAPTVNERRKKAGFDQTVEENAKRLGTNYEALTLKQVEEMRGR